MIDVFVSDLVKWLGGNLIIGNPRLAVKKISIDTRTMERGNFFLALKGNNFDGHAFLQQTLEKSVGGLIISHLDKTFGKNPLSYRQLPTIVQVKDTLAALQQCAHHYRRKFNTTVTAVTGSNGKTTTKEILANILSQEHQCLCTYKNYNNHIGLPLTLLNLDNECTFTVVEMGASAQGDIKRLSEIASPTIGIITNISSAHLATFGSINNIFQSKMELFDYLPKEGTAVINADDPLLSEVKNNLQCKTVTFGFHKPCDVLASQITSWPKASFRLEVADKSYQVNLSFPGLFNVYNALAAAAAAWKLGIAPEMIVSGLEGSSLPPMRNEVLSTQSHGIIINDAYNANPGSMRASLMSFMNAYPKQVKIAVIGDMLELGGSSEQEHVSLGEFLASLPLDYIMIVGTYRQHVQKGALKAGLSTKKVKTYEKKENLIDDLRSNTNTKSAAFFKASRSMQFELVINQLVQSDSNGT